MDVHHNHKDESLNSGPEKGIGKYVGMIVGSSFFTFGMSVLNQYHVQESAVGYSQMWMEGIDMALPIPVGLASSADKRGRKKLAIGLRSVTNLAHVGASVAGIIEARDYLIDSPQPTAGNVAIAALVGVINLGIFRSLRRHRHDHGPVPLTPLSISEPEEANVLLDESLHTHPADSSRNIENLEVCVRSNIWEAGPGVTYPLWAAINSPGIAAATVIGANAAIAVMNGAQFVKDMNMLRHNT